MSPTVLKYNFDLTEVSAIAIDISTNQEYIWIAFKKNSLNYCEIRKVSPRDINQVYFVVKLDVEEITCMEVFEGRLFVGVESNYPIIGYSIAKFNPLSDVKIITITNENYHEKPVDLTCYHSSGYGDHCYFLLPGNNNNSKALIIDYHKNLEDVSEIHYNLSPIVIDTNTINHDVDGNLWITTTENESRLIKLMFNGSGDVNSREDKKLIIT